jgi:Zn-dependent M28 family amino/carboxypeptidase
MSSRIAAVLVVVGLLIARPCPAQAPRERLDTEVINKIREEGLKKSKAMETISYLTDVHGPRLTASPQIRAAAEWTQGRLKEWGLENVHLESWGPFGRGWNLEGFTCNIVQPSYAPLIAYPKAWSPSTPKTIRGEPILLDAAKEEDLEKFRGKLHRAIVLLSPAREVKALFDPPAKRQSDAQLLSLANGETRSRYVTPSNAAPTNAPTPPGAPGAAPGTPFGASAEQRAAIALQNRKWQMIYDEGAAVVLEPGRGDGGTVFVASVQMPPTQMGSRDGQQSASQNQQPPAGDNSPLNRGPRPWSKDAPEIVPQVVLAVEHYNRLVRMLEKKTPVQLEIDIASRYYADDLSSFNIVGEIPGGELKDELVMLGGHFDSWHGGTGATDNAVGCGVALEAIRILQSLGIKPRRTIRLALWTGEEQGLLGSKAYVTDHFGKATTPPQTGGRGGRSGRSGNATTQDRSASEASSSVATQPPPATTETADQNKAQATPATGATAQAPQRPTKYELKPDHAKFAAYFNLDNGTGKVRGVYLQGNEAVRPIFRAWLAPFADLGALTISPSNTGGTDHLSFDAVGLPGFQFIQDQLEYDTRTHHSTMDVFDRLQEDDVKQASVIMAAFVYNAAMRDEKLPRKPLVGEIIDSKPQQ